MRIAIIVEAVPPFCGGGEQVAWTHAVELAKKFEVSVITFGESLDRVTREGVAIHYLPTRKRNLVAYSTFQRQLLNKCVDDIAPTVLHCHMPNVLSACLEKKGRLLVSTIHDGIPENKRLTLGSQTRARWLKFKLVRRINIRKADAITCVSRHNLEIMRTLYPAQVAKFCFIPNPISDKYFAPVAGTRGTYVLNFGRQIPLKVSALLDTAKLMPDTVFTFVGTGELVRDHGLPNVNFVGFSDAIERYIDEASVCVFPSLSENFPLVGLEAMARGKPVIASKMGFSEYMDHMRSGYLLDSVDPVAIKNAIETLLSQPGLCELIGQAAREVAEQYRPASVVGQYIELYEELLSRRNTTHRSEVG